MLKQVRQFIHAQRLVVPGVLVVAVSGGADSLALLHVLIQLSPALGVRLHVATLNHHLRAQAGAEDARFVARTAAAWGLPVTAGDADVPALARSWRVGIETAARRARYEFLAQVAAQVGAAQVAVAHHMGDQAETVLMHLLRGSGLRGLGGMRAMSAVPGHPHLALARPLLAVTRAEIEAYCRHYGLTPRQDATNQDTTLLRNRIRAETLPNLERMNPHVQRALAQLADAAAQEDDYVTQQFRREVVPLVTRETGRLWLPLDRFRGLHPALRRRFIIWALDQLVGAGGDLAHIHVVAAEQIGLRGAVGALAPLPGGLRLRVDYHMVNVEFAAAPLVFERMPLLPEETEMRVTVPGITVLPGGEWGLQAQPAPEDGARLIVPPASVITLRTLRPGDRFSPPGLNGHTQKISRWLVNHKVPRALRPRLPLLTIDGQIAAIMVGTQWTLSEAAVPKNGEITQTIYFKFISFVENA